MKNLTLLTLLTFLAAGSALADDTKHQTYISYDDGGTLVRPLDDDREIEARVNLPIFPGDEVITNRRGRTEVRLADGNVLGVDRATAIRFVSILDSYEGEADETIVELRYGKVAIYRVEDAREHLRLDTPSATYFASDEAIFSVETDSRGRDRVSVLDGVIEVRTPARTTRLRRGEQADVDDRGMYEVADYSSHAADDFERWFLNRAERYGDVEGRYLDRSLAYYEDDLSRHGSWVHINHYGWAWRPSVAVGWRPYHNGYWMRARSGCLTWVSYEPWGWVPYHYGRWSHDPYYGWFWVPGIGYAPAWVYWWYGNGYLGWAPAGWWDLHRPYYNWNYRPYHRAGLSLGFGFYGRVKIHDVDLRPWTFIDSNTIHSNRVDRAALSTDVIRARLQRDNDGFATISNDPARF
ncbi:MAG TPA: FecR family protein, partial [Thermoanaerobaculia bacterium]|nr:FecR family protein [Thermoanaerobaculia bacterium]